MPTIVRKDGFDVFFYANEHLPRHVHVKKGDDFAKVNLETMEPIVSTFKAGDHKRMMAIVVQYQEELRNAWNEYFGTR